MSRWNNSTSKDKPTYIYIYTNTYINVLFTQFPD